MLVRSNTDQWRSKYVVIGVGRAFLSREFVAGRGSRIIHLLRWRVPI